jgi:hypothetical protein
MRAQAASMRASSVAKHTRTQPAVALPNAAPSMTDTF